MATIVAESWGTFVGISTNLGNGIICETEADTLGQTFKNDWGSYSDMLRKSFHHEKISLSRKMESEFIEVNEPKLSVALSGTPKQVFNIINSAEDGLFSRFLYYVFETDAIWLDPSPQANPLNLNNFFKKQSTEVLSMVEFFEKHSLIIKLTETQWERFNIVFSSYLKQINTFVSTDAQSVVKRLGLIFFRFCMIFTAIRKFSKKDLHDEIYCSEIDFESALTLIDVYLQHSIIMFTNLPKQGGNSPFKSSENKNQLYEALPEKFSRKEAVDLGKTFRIKERTVDSMLKDCLGAYLHKSDYGSYEKIK